MPHRQGYIFLSFFCEGPLLLDGDLFLAWQSSVSRTITRLLLITVQLFWRVTSSQYLYHEISFSSESMAYVRASSKESQKVVLKTCFCCHLKKYEVKIFSSYNNPIKIDLLIILIGSCQY
jgi:uncharacterized HAD superfamily protein